MALTYIYIYMYIYIYIHIYIYIYGSEIYQETHKSINTTALVEGLSGLGGYKYYYY